MTRTELIYFLAGMGTLALIFMALVASGLAWAVWRWAPRGRRR